MSQALAGDNVRHSGMYVFPPRMCGMHSVVAGLPWQLGILRTQRQLSSAALCSLRCGDQ